MFYVIANGNTDIVMQYEHMFTAYEECECFKEIRKGLTVEAHWLSDSHDVLHRLKTIAVSIPLLLYCYNRAKQGLLESSLNAKRMSSLISPKYTRLKHKSYVKMIHICLEGHR